jgi:hypothetical protein
MCWEHVSHSTVFGQRVQLIPATTKKSFQGWFSFISASLSWIYGVCTDKNSSLSLVDFFFFFSSLSSLFLGLCALPLEFSSQPLNFYFFFILSVMIFFLKYFIELDFCFDFIIIQFCFVKFSFHSFKYYFFVI